MARKTIKKQTPNESLDHLFKQSLVIRNSAQYRDFLTFVGRFKKYSAYNNMLIYIQNPDCQFFATAKDWKKNFNREVKEHERPMVILAPMHPVLFVFDVHQTEGDSIPPNYFDDWKEVTGYYREKWLLNISTYFKDLNILAKEMKMAPTKGGSIQRKGGGFQINLNAIHDEAANFSTLIHEIAHLFLGHLGSNDDEKFPNRENLTTSIREIEAESVAYLVLQRLGLHTKAATYLAFYNRNPDDFKKISIDLMLKTVSKIERMIKKPFQPK